MSEQTTTSADQRSSAAATAGSVETLLEALPYIREFHGRTVVIKYGGAAMREDSLRDEFATDVVLLKYVGLNPVIVHGGGPEITAHMERLGMKVKFVEGLRVSDRETVEVAKMVLLGKVNTDIVQRLNRHGQPAVGLSGEDGTLFEIRPAPEAEKVGFVGEIERVDVDVLNHIASDFIPVIASAGTARDGNSYNVNADSAAGKVAAALRAYKAIFLTDVEGWRADGDDPQTLVSLATVEEVVSGLGRVGGGMRRGDSRRGPVRPHHRWASAAQPAARAVHRCGDRHQGHAVSVSGIEELQALEARYAMPTYARAPVEFVRGRGCLLWDSEGREYIDFFSGLSVHNAGHCHPAIVAAVRDQVGELAGSSNLYYSSPAIQLHAKLSEASLGGRVFLCNSGTEANECAIKLARRHAHRRGVDRPEIVVLDGGFHGRTLGALSATVRLADEELFGPLLEGFVLVPRDDPTALGVAVGERTAAVLLEPVQGEAGVHPIGDDVLGAAREACDRSGALLVFDEIQTGMGRTGELWAYELGPAMPDVLTAAKALGGGLPVGACVTAPAVGEGLGLGEHGSTFG
ncbi:MAG: acetylglutamate kinase, partial [Solirubrobacterales bacterium]